MVSLEACMEDDNHGIHEIAADIGDIAEIATGNDFAERFIARLSVRDREILELRLQGYTYQEIGERLGYKNPSGAIKRMQVIAKMLRKYEDEQQ